MTSKPHPALVLGLSYKRHPFSFRPGHKKPRSKPRIPDPGSWILTAPQSTPGPMIHNTETETSTHAKLGCVCNYVFVCAFSSRTEIVEKHVAPPSRCTPRVVTRLEDTLSGVIQVHISGPIPTAPFGGTAPDIHSYSQDQRYPQALGLTPRIRAKVSSNDASAGPIPPPLRRTTPTIHSNPQNQRYPRALSLTSYALDSRLRGQPSPCAGPMPQAPSQNDAPYTRFSLQKRYPRVLDLRVISCGDNVGDPLQEASIR